MSWGQKKEGGEKVPFPRFLLLGALMKLRGKLEEEEDGLSTTRTPHSPPFFLLFSRGEKAWKKGDGSFVYVLWDWVTTSTPPCVSHFPSFLFPPLFYIGCKTKPRNSIVWRWEKPPPKKAAFSSFCIFQLPPKKNEKKAAASNFPIRRFLQPTHSPPPY